MTYSTAFYADAVLADSPALYWRLDETSGTVAADASGNGRNGTYTGGFTLGQSRAVMNSAWGPVLNAASPALRPGDGGNSVALNGSTGWITSTYAAFASTRTFEGWAYYTDGSVSCSLFGGTGARGPQLRIITGTAPFAVQFDANTFFGGSHVWTGAWPNTNQWVHWVLVHTDTNNAPQLYINGVLQTLTAGTNSTYDGTGNLGTFEAGITANFEPFKGRMDEIAVYTSALSAAQIQAHYFAGTAARPPRFWD